MKDSSIVQKNHPRGRNEEMSLLKKLTSLAADAVRSLFKKGFFHIFGSEFLSRVIGFATGIIIVRVLSKELFGVYSYANNILGFFLLLSGLGVQSAVLQFCSEKEQSAEKLPFFKYGLKLGLWINALISEALIGFTLLFRLPIEAAGKSSSTWPSFRWSRSAMS